MNKNALEISHLNVSYGGVKALKDISLTVPEGDYLAIIGPNGGGKSTLLRAALGLIPVDGGDILLLGDKPSKSRPKAGYVPQYSMLDRRFPMTVFETVLTGRFLGGKRIFKRYTSLDKDVAMAKIEETGLQKLANRSIGELSGGEFQRVLIARALASDSQILFLDEPTANVDANARETIYSLIATLNRSITIVMVTHDLFALSSEVKSVACLNTELVYHGAPELRQDVLGKLYGCPVELIAHGVPHRVFDLHGENHHD